MVEHVLVITLLLGLLVFGLSYMRLKAHSDAKDALCEQAQNKLISALRANAQSGQLVAEVYRYLSHPTPAQRKKVEDAMEVFRDNRRKINQIKDSNG